ncbi:MAG: recombination mediator RecR [Mariprofundaceae bacterium]
MMDFPGMPPALARAVEMLGSLPGIGPKTATRLALNLLSRPAEDVRALARVLELLHEQVRFCPRCGAFAGQGECAFCDDARRDGALICVVEQPVDVLMLERGRHYRGRYHVLHGRLSPIDGVSVEDLWIAQLDARLDDGVRELILATSATVDGEATAHFLARRYEARPVRISRIARGVPEGGELEYLDEHTISRAIDQRVSWEPAEPA